MNFLVGAMTAKIEIFLFVLVRMSALFIISPIFGRKNMPQIFKIGFSCLTALILVNVVSLPMNINTNSIYDFTMVIIKEFVAGLIIGYIGYLVLTAIYLAGQMIDTQIGLGIVSVIDPTSNMQVPVTANFYYTLAMVLFLTMNGHHMLISAVTDSYKVIPIGAMVYDKLVLDQIVQLMITIFIIAFKIAAPIIAVALICDVALGILSRTMPQMNIFFVGMPLKIFIGFATIMITIPAFMMIMNFSMDLINQQTTEVINNMVPKKP